MRSTVLTNVCVQYRLFNCKRNLYGRSLECFQSPMTKNLSPFNSSSLILPSPESLATTILLYVSLC